MKTLPSFVKRCTKNYSRNTVGYFLILNMEKGKLKQNLIIFGIDKLLRAINRTPRVLFYHGVDHVNESSSLHIAPKKFEQEIKFLSHHYEVIDLDEYFERFRQNKFSNREIVITFDDGYRNNLTHAAPILQAFNLPFTVFVSAGHIESGKRFPTAIARTVILSHMVDTIEIECIRFKSPLANDRQRKHVYGLISHTLKHSNIDLVNEICKELIENLPAGAYQEFCARHTADDPLNWEEVKKLQTDYKCIIGAHCLDHFICNGYQTREQTRRQLIDSKRLIEEKTNSACHYMAYPNGIVHEGDVSDNALEAVAEAGYRLAFTTENDRLLPGNNPYLMPRHSARFEMNDFIMKLALKPKLKI